MVNMLASSMVDREVESSMVDREVESWSSQAW